MGMVGGGRGAFIGGVHRIAARLDGESRLVAGAFSSTPEKSLESGRELGLDPARTYPTWRKMLEAERRRPVGDRIDFVSVVTPNHQHFEVAKAFAEAGFHVVCDKPLVHDSAQAGELVEIVRRANVVFAVTYNYSGYPMVKQARHLARSGALGPLRRVIVEYQQGWLSSNLEATGQKQAAWRTDPKLAGRGGAVGDIGSHAEQLVSYVTGLELESICADLTSFVPGRRLDDDANVLLRFLPRDGVAAHGVLTVSQVAAGCENGLRLRVSGERASLDWRQEEPNSLRLRPIDAPEQVFRRGGNLLSDAARNAARLPPGHPEGFLEAFANVYRAAFAAIRAGAGGPDAGEAFDFPSVIDGARGVHFIEKTVESAGGDRKWTDARFRVGPVMP